jgi:hypothetical protein
VQDGDAVHTGVNSLSQDVQDSEEGDYIAGKKKGDESRSNTDSKGPGGCVKPPIGKKERHDPFLENVLKHEKRYGDGDETRIEAHKKGA